MAYNDALAERVRMHLRQAGHESTEKKMMGGLCFMVNDKMCVGIFKDLLMARIDPEKEPLLLKEQGARPMDFTGKPMKGYLFIDESGTDRENLLEFWVKECLSFNPKAKASKKRG